MNLHWNFLCFEVLIEFYVSPHFFVVGCTLFFTKLTSYQVNIYLAHCDSMSGTDKVWFSDKRDEISSMYTVALSSQYTKQNHVCRNSYSCNHSYIFIQILTNTSKEIFFVTDSWAKIISFDRWECMKLDEQVTATNHNNCPWYWP